MAAVKDIDRGWKKIMPELLRNAGKIPEVYVGIPEKEGAKDKESPDGPSNYSLAEIAAVHEFGSEDGTIPKRSFLRDWVDGNRDDIEKFLVRALVAQTEGQRIEKGLGQLGEYAIGQIKERISDNIPPPLSDATIKRKGSSVALIDTGQLRGSISWEISQKKGGESGS